MNKFIYSILMSGMILFFTGCDHDVSIQDVPIQCSASLLIPSVPSDPKRIFLQIKDQTGFASEIAHTMEELLQKKGYVIVNDWDSTTLRLWVNLIQFDQKTSEHDAFIVRDASKEFSADHKAVAQIELITLKGEKLKSSFSVGVNVYKNIGVSLTPKMQHQIWNRLIQQLARAISNIFE